MDSKLDEYPEKAKPKSLFMMGNDLAKMPCFKKTFLYGITSGIGSGLLVFMFTSRVPLACHTVMGVLGCTTLSYFSYCRYHFAKEQYMLSQMHGLVNEAFSMTDTEKEEVIKGLTETFGKS